jgi:hypothetical protein
MKLKAGTIKRIHVNKYIISDNFRNGNDNPPITVQTSKGAFTARRVDFTGSAAFIYSPNKPLKCGARCWVETKSELELL